MAPALIGFDHAHFEVGNKDEAEQWYADVFGFRRVEALDAWDTENGPRTLEDPSGRIHLAVFEREDRIGGSSVAYKVDAEGFLAWKAHLENMGLSMRITDHKLSYSLYVEDPWGNNQEITTYERDAVAQRLR